MGVKGRSYARATNRRRRTKKSIHMERIEMQNDFFSENPDSRWFAVWTRSRQEKIAAAMLLTLGVEHYLPLKSELRQWSDRKQQVLVPLFSGYLFVRIDLDKDSRLQVLKTPGIAGLVGNGAGPMAIPDRQIEDIRTVLSTSVDCSVLPLLEEGAWVRVVHGPLAGVEGRLLQGNSTSRLLISIEMIHKSLAVSVSRCDVEPVAPMSTPQRQPVQSPVKSNRIFPAAHLVGAEEANKLEVFR
jgi:transcriptional antiterminator NusG